MGNFIDQRRAATLWRQIESTFKHTDTAGIELECFQALQKQGAASSFTQDKWSLGGSSETERA